MTVQQKPCNTIRCHRLLQQSRSCQSSTLTAKHVDASSVRLGLVLWLIPLSLETTCMATASSACLRGTCEVCIGLHWAAHTMFSATCIPAVSCDTQMASFGLRCLRPHMALKTHLQWPPRAARYLESLTRTKAMARIQDAINVACAPSRFLLTCFVTCGQLGWHWRTRTRPKAL
jgi:hypothetical protein